MSELKAETEKRESRGRTGNAIVLQDVCKQYRLYANLTEQALDALGLERFLFWKRAKHRLFTALDEITLVVPHGERLGIVGRNGAGKTTLLKLLTGNFVPSSGTVTVGGSVQALMQVGLGFHGEFTGYENVRTALAYNGLSGKDFDEALKGIVRFAELGEYLHQPVKTYSLGMRARLQFAAATAVKPDIVIVDEVLGAGDAYFGAKSAARMENLTKSGCTLLLVSHSMQQVLQFCERVIWLEEGQIVKDGDALSVVRAYEEYVRKLEYEAEQARMENRDGDILDNKWLRRKLVGQVTGEQSLESESKVRRKEKTQSRWPGEAGLKIHNLRTVNGDQQERHVFRTRERMIFEFEIEAEVSGRFRCCYVILLFTEGGDWVCRHCSDFEEFDAFEGERRKVVLEYPSLLLGNGTYVFSAAIYKTLNLENVTSAKYYDLLSRSFEFKIIDANRDDQSKFHHPATWHMAGSAS